MDSTEKSVRFAEAWVKVAQATFRSNHWANARCFDCPGSNLIQIIECVAKAFYDVTTGEEAEAIKT